jgi:hypothetical protein
MHFQQFLGFEGVESRFVTALESTRVSDRFIIRCFIVIIIDVVVVSNMLAKVIFALEAVVASIPRSRAGQYKLCERGIVITYIERQC